ncbi:hypothetical protein BDY19DRAFT_966665, partial [Irpex rosettiformis]
MLFEGCHVSIHFINSARPAQIRRLRFTMALHHALSQPHNRKARSTRVLICGTEVRRTRCLRT